jgi:hypothetical protein
VVLLVRKVQQVLLLGQLAQLVHKEFKARRALQDHKEFKDHKALQDHKGFKDHKALKGFKDLPAHKGFKELLVRKDRVVLQAQLGLMLHR